LAQRKDRKWPLALDNSNKVADASVVGKMRRLGITDPADPDA
jgi:hypothetical protein